MSVPIALRALRYLLCKPLRCRLAQLAKLHCGLTVVSKGRGGRTNDRVECHGLALGRLGAATTEKPPTRLRPTFGLAVVLIGHRIGFSPSCCFRFMCATSSSGTRALKTDVRR